MVHTSQRKHKSHLVCKLAYGDDGLCSRRLGDSGRIAHQFSDQDGKGE